MKYIILGIASLLFSVSCASKSTGPVMPPQTGGGYVQQAK